MGLFDKLFGKKEDIQKQKRPETTQEAITQTAEMLEEDLYWKIVASSLQHTNYQYDQEQFLIKEIGKLTPHQMIGFRLRTDKLLYDTYNAEMWCAGYIMKGGCSDDGFEYFRNWVISRGRGVYYAAKENPDSLITETGSGTDEFEFENFWYVALEAFKDKTAQDLYDYVDDENFKTKEGNYPQFEFNWTDEDPESMRKICPRLFEKFWNSHG